MNIIDRLRRNNMNKKKYDRKYGSKKDYAMTTTNTVQTTGTQTSITNTALGAPASGYTITTTIPTNTTWINSPGVWTNPHIATAACGGFTQPTYIGNTTFQQWPQNFSRNYVVRFEQKTEEAKFVDKLADVKTMEIFNVTSYEYTMDNGEEFLKLEMFSGEDSYLGVYKGMYDNSYFMVVEEFSASANKVFSRTMEIEKVEKFHNSCNASFNEIPKISLTVRVKTVSVSVLSNGNLENIKLP